MHYAFPGVGLVPPGTFRADGRTAEGTSVALP